MKNRQETSRISIECLQIGLLYPTNHNDQNRLENDLYSRYEFQREYGRWISLLLVFHSYSLSDLYSVASMNLPSHQERLGAVVCAD